jgi:protein-S-isoprenylcysteine O-methyltransferase Ste14
LHIISSIIAFFSVIPLLIYNFKINFFSIIFVIIFILGVIVIYASSVKIKDQALKPHGKLIISGVYKNVRNPMYLGIILLAYSCFFISFSLYVLSYALTVNLLYLIIINAEEKDLIKQFGKDYINYKKKVPSLIPRL